MRVYNLTESPLYFRGKMIPPDGGYVDLSDASFVPDRDRELVEKKVIAFDRIPAWFETHLKLKRVTQLAEQVKTQRAAAAKPPPRRRNSV